MEDSLGGLLMRYIQLWNLEIEEFKFISTSFSHLRFSLSPFSHIQRS